MKKTKIILTLFTVTATVFLTGCATPDDQYHDEQEYSNMPWNTPQDWEGSRSIPGMSGGSY
jgi:PBP1b-binding outer membrane lipoprotein LpoB